MTKYHGRIARKPKEREPHENKFAAASHTFGDQLKTVIEKSGLSEKSIRSHFNNSAPLHEVPRERLTKAIKAIGLSLDQFQNNL